MVFVTFATIPTPHEMIAIAMSKYEMDNLPFLILYDKVRKPQQILQPSDGNCPYYML
jgi:hypothetical protein